MSVCDEMILDLNIFRECDGNLAGSTVKTSRAPLYFDPLALLLCLGS